MSEGNGRMNLLPGGVDPAVPRIVITMLPKGGGVKVEGPVEDRVLCYGMMEAARDAIAKHHLDKANGARIVRGDMSDLPPAPEEKK